MALGFDDATEFARLLSKREIISRWQAAQLLAGRTQMFLGNYKLLERLGQGGMGSVFLAEHTTMNRRVALKVVNHKGDDSAAAEQLRSEARAIGLLDHPNIIQAYDVDSEGDRFYIVMEYVPGRDLNAMVMDEGPLPMDKAVDYVRQAAEGLAHAHERGMIHCDIKPSNLLVDAAGVVKILDLGVARLSEEEEVDDDSDATKPPLGGTIDYQAPEHARGAADFDRRADIYSLGCTLYCLLAGHPPFPSGSQTKRILQHQTQPPPDLRSIRPEIPEDLNAICMKMLAKNPDERYQTASEVAAVLGAWTPPKVTDLGLSGESDEVFDGPLGLNSLELNTFKEPLESSAVRRRKEMNTLAHLWIAATFVLAVVLFLIILIVSRTDTHRPDIESPIVLPPNEVAVSNLKPPIVTPPNPVPQPVPDPGDSPKEPLGNGKSETPTPADPAPPQPPDPIPPSEGAIPEGPPAVPSEVSPAEPAPAEPAPEEPPKPEEPPPEPKPVPVFSTFPEMISLPPSDAAGQWHFIGLLEGPADAALKIELLGGTFDVRPENSSQNRTDRVEFKLLETAPGTTWTIESDGTPVASLNRDVNRIVFRWETTDSKLRPELLQYAVFRLLSGEETHDLLLTRPIEIQPLLGDFREADNGILRRPLPEIAIRDADSFRVAMTRIDGPEGALSLDAVEPLSPSDNKRTVEGPKLTAASIDLTFILSASRDSVNLSARYSLHGGKTANISRKQLLTLQGLAPHSQGAAEILSLVESFALNGRVHFRAYRQVGDKQIDVVITKDPPANPE